jgi:gamma-glutamyltranspeptidase
MPFGTLGNDVQPQAVLQVLLNMVVFGMSPRQVIEQPRYLDETHRSIFGPNYAAAPDVLIKQLKRDEAIAEPDTLLLTVPNQLGVDYNAHAMEAILTHVAPALGWR